MYSAKTKPREIKYKILNEENKIWRIIPGRLTVKREVRSNRK
jgi:hypothetical protein